MRLSAPSISRATSSLLHSQIITRRKWDPTFIGASWRPELRSPKMHWWRLSIAPMRSRGNSASLGTEPAAVLTSTRATSLPQKSSSRVPRTMLTGFIWAEGFWATYILDMSKGCTNPSLGPTPTIVLRRPSRFSPNCAAFISERQHFDTQRPASDASSLQALETIVLLRRRMLAVRPRVITARALQTGHK